MFGQDSRFRFCLPHLLCGDNISKIIDDRVQCADACALEIHASDIEDRNITLRDKVQGGILPDQVLPKTVS